jgi:Protein of unknown function (DUF402)
MRFEPGQTIVRRSLAPDGRISSCTAGRVLADDDRGLLMWIDARSHFVSPRTLDGKRTRHLPYAQELRMPLLPGLSTFFAEGGALVLTPPGTPHSTLWFFNGRNDFTGWYINLETPAARWMGGVDIHDRALDVLVAPDRSWQWKDEDEFAEQTGHPLFWDEAEAALVRAEGLRMISLAEQGVFPFDGTHCDFKPDPRWEPSILPWFWDLKQ